MKALVLGSLVALSFNTLVAAAVTPQKCYDLMFVGGADGQKWHSYFAEADACDWFAVGIKDPDAARDWFDAGFTPEDAVIWKEHIQNPKTAATWVKSGIRPAEAAIWASGGFAPADIKPWVEAGIEPDMSAWFGFGLNPAVALAEMKKHTDLGVWQAVGLNYEYVDGWRKAGLTVEDVRTYGNVKAAEALEARRSNRAMESACPAAERLHEDELMQANPYATKGKCYDLDSIWCFQLLGRYSGLYNLTGDSANPFLIRLHFPTWADAPNKGTVFGALLVGKGAVQYTSSAGVLQTVPSFEVVGVSGIDTK